MNVPGYNQIPWNAWSIGNFQDNTNNRNQQLWNPWPAVLFPPTAQNTNQQNSALFVESNVFQSIAGNLNNMQSKPENLATEHSMLLQSMPNENRLKSYSESYSSRYYFNRKNKRKNWKQNHSRQVLNQITDNTANLPHQRWNHTPELNWFQKNLPPSYMETNFQNPFKFGSFSKRHKNSPQFQNLAHNKFTYTSSNFSGSNHATRIVVPRAKFGSRCPLKYSGNNVGNAALHGPSNCNRPSIMEKEKYQSDSNANPRNFPNINKSNMEDDDITYLYTVDSSSESKMVLEIDLQSDSVNLVCKSPGGTVNLIQESQKDTGADQINTVGKHELSIPLTTRKRKLEANFDEKSNKRSSYQPECTACHMCYDDLIGKSETMYISSSCSHIFCRPCVSKDSHIKVCPACGITFLAFRRLYL